MAEGADAIIVGGHRLEFRSVPPARAGLPTLVFLHQGLGSVSMWRDFPARLAARTGCGALLYSRLGYGWSDPAPRPRRPDFLLEEGQGVLPQVLAACGLHDVIVIGHSDGGTAALAYLGRGQAARAAIVVAPHVFVEDITWREIARQREDWGASDLRRRLARHHRDADAMFHSWAEIWLSPGFRSWSMAALLRAIKAPLLAVQGYDDPYGTMRQIDEIARLSGGPVELARLEACGHDPFRDQPEPMLELCARFIAQA
jgi:pimeloyl-ACP methyl ester carboxylesterase